ncbi:MAG TPA: preprotein translocase subunit SecG [Caldisericia bacterium]|nr:preprotein translocase subunit SecG [Caldisericia bacterium]
MKLETLRLIFLILDFASSIGIILGYLFQSPKASGLGSISGGATVYKARKPLDAFLDKLIIWCSIVFAISTLILAVLRPV